MSTLTKPINVKPLEKEIEIENDFNISVHESQKNFQIIGGNEMRVKNEPKDIETKVTTVDSKIELKEISSNEPLFASSNSEISLKKFSNPNEFKRIDLEWENLNITAISRKKVIVENKRKTIKENKTILNNISGSVRNGRFTAIMGPSGSGKTTLLNFLSARISGRNLKIKGNLKVNGQTIKSLDSISYMVAYVMQDDVLTATITPREALMFVANLRLKASHSEKKKRVEALLEELGIKHCSNTIIGNNLIRGISGGERKRTSIGVEIITNPSMIFLDEPTTGLDSKTAANVISLLVNLAKVRGRTVVSTIHQPSSQIFSQFDELLLLVRGNIIYQGKASNAIDYFGSIGYQCPPLTNPAEYFMKIMNESGILVDFLNEATGKKSLDALNMRPQDIEKKFMERVKFLTESYKNSMMVTEVKKDVITDPLPKEQNLGVSWFVQFWHIFVIKLQDQLRNPMEGKIKIISAIVFGIVVAIVFNNLGLGEAGIQNRKGLLFFITQLAVFKAVDGSVATFAGERAIFVRERLNQTYSTSSYFWAKCLAELPMFFLQPTLLLLVSYFAVGLDMKAWKFFAQLINLVCAYLAGSGFGLLISACVPSLEIAADLIALTLIPLLVFGGYLVTSEHIPKFFYELVYISPFKYSYQAAVQIEFESLDIQCEVPCDPTRYDREEGIAFSMGLLLIVAFTARIIAYFGLAYISTPKKPKIETYVEK